MTILVLFHALLDFCFHTHPGNLLALGSTDLPVATAAVENLQTADKGITWRNGSYVFEAINLKLLH